MKKEKPTYLHLFGEDWERELIDEFFIGNNFSEDFEMSMIRFFRKVLKEKIGSLRKVRRILKTPEMYPIEKRAKEIMKKLNPHPRNKGH